MGFTFENAGCPSRGLVLSATTPRPRTAGSVPGLNSATGSVPGAGQAIACGAGRRCVGGKQFLEVVAPTALTPRLARRSGNQNFTQMSAVLAEIFK